MKTKTSAKVTEPFRGVKDGQIYPEDLKVGDVIEGDLAGAAMASGKAEEITTEAVTADVEVSQAETPSRRGRRASRASRQ